MWLGGVIFAPTEVELLDVAILQGLRLGSPFRALNESLEAVDLARVETPNLCVEPTNRRVFATMQAMVMSSISNISLKIVWNVSTRPDPTSSIRAASKPAGSFRPTSLSILSRQNTVPEFGDSHFVGITVLNTRLKPTLDRVGCTTILTAR